MKRDFYELYRVLETLRGENGCPWDRAQTHESLKPYLLEEAYEACEAIDLRDAKKTADELGDVLLQVVMHSLIGKENGEFDIDDVTDGVCEKMIARHPHIFGDESASNPEEVLSIWEEIKKKERGQTTIFETLSSVSRAMPSVKRADKLQRKTAKIFAPGETFSDVLPLFKKLSASLDETSSPSDFADVLFLFVRLASLLGFDCEDILREKNENFIKKIENIEKTTCNPEECLVEYRSIPIDELWLG